MSSKATIISESEEETFKLGEIFAERINLGNNIALNGDLGVGKTIFIKGICAYFNVNEDITSPTFNFLNIYQGENNQKNVDIFHIDLYRINSSTEAMNIGFYEWLYEKNAIKLIEWADKLENLSSISFEINLKYDLDKENRRIIEIKKM